MKIFKVLKAASKIVTIFIPQSLLIKLSINILGEAIEYLEKVDNKKCGVNRADVAIVKKIAKK